MKEELRLFIGLTNYLLDGVTSDGGWDSEPGFFKETNPLNTAEALCGLISVRYQLRIAGMMPTNFDQVVNNAIKYLLSTQLPSGGWATGSAYKHPSDTMAKGNTVSTCFALWALLLYNDLIKYDEEILEVINSAIDFFEQCKTNDGVYLYSPDLDEPSVVSTAYVFLAFSQILSSHIIRNNLVKEKRLQIENALKDLAVCINEECFINEAKQQRISSILIYLSIQYLSDEPVLMKNTIKRIEKAYHDVIMDMSLTDCTTPYLELQVVREKGKSGRDFTHYVPVWVLMVYSLCDSSSDILIHKPKVLSTIINNIDSKYNGVSIGLGSKRTIWATGITLFSLSMFITYNYKFENILKQEEMKMVDNKKVFIVHGRDMEFKNKIVNFLRALSLQPLEWDSVVGETGKATPTTHEVIIKGFEIAQVIIVLLTGDDEGKLIDKFIKDTDDDLERTISPQPRLNVVYEAGLAFGINPKRTLIVRKPGDFRKISDVDGFNYVYYDGTSQKRNTLVGRLQAAGCSVDTSGNDWLTI